MHITDHGSRRIQQRGFSRAVLNIIMEHGEVEQACGGALRISFRRKERQAAATELKRVLQLLDRAQGGHIVIKDGHLLTAYKNRQV